MKKFLLVAAVGLTLVMGCRKIEEDGEIVYLPGPGTGGGNTGQTITLRNTITSDTTLRKGNTYILSGRVFIEKGATINIEAGVTVKGEFSGSNVAALIIKRGAKINAVGTASEPIVFTSNAPTPKSGDWGGLVICGTARVNSAFNSTPGLYAVEGGINDATTNGGLAGSGDALYPTPNDDDNSGVLQYVRIEYAGYAFVPDSEINSLTLAAVGRGTTIDHIQITYAKDDAIEWFGGTVNCKYLITYKTQDDDFDTDNGYNGQVQFGLIVRDSTIADISRSEAFESDNNATGSTALPKTAPIFSNITMVGPRATLTNVGNSLYLGSAVQIRRNSALSLYNSVILGWANGILIDAGLGTPTDLNIQSNDLRIKNVLIAGSNNPISYTPSSTAATGADNASIAAWFNGQASPATNRVLTNVDDARYTRPFNYTNYDFQPYANPGSPIINFPSATPAVLNNVDFSDSKLVAAIATTAPNKIEVVTFRGAVATAGDLANWYKGWSVFN